MAVIEKVIPSLHWYSIVYIYNSNFEYPESNFIFWLGIEMSHFGHGNYNSQILGGSMLDSKRIYWYVVIYTIEIQKTSFATC